jgi:hypothetical protein
VWAREDHLGEVAMTIKEARALAAPHAGVTVRRNGKSWSFFAQFNTTDGRRMWYAGKSLERAIALRAELVAKFARSGGQRRSAA